MNTNQIFYTFEGLKEINAGKISHYEFAFCKTESPIKQISESKIKFDFKHFKSFQKDSLFVLNDAGMVSIDKFIKSYDKYFTNPTTPDGNHTLDFFGVNYYTKKQTEQIYKQLSENKRLPDLKVLMDWLKTCIEKYNGFYFLGI